MTSVYGGASLGATKNDSYRHTCEQKRDFNLKSGCVIYLTGAPATGKSTLCENLKCLYDDLICFSYSAELRKYITEKGARGKILSEDEIRNKSARLVTVEDVVAVDHILQDLINSKRLDHKIIIDSHPVTIEEYGFRITPYSGDELRKISPDAVVCLYAEPGVISDRIRNDPQGRPSPSNFELEMHILLQSTMAAQYSVQVGCPAYLIDSDNDEQLLIDTMTRIIERC